MENITVTLSDAQFEQLKKEYTMATEKRSDRKRIELMNSELYLYTIPEAKALMRMDKERFVREFLKTGKIAITKIDGRKMIAFMDLRDFLISNKYYYRRS